MKTLTTLPVICATVSLFTIQGYAQSQSSEQSSGGKEQKAPVEFSKSTSLGGKDGLAVEPGQKQVLFIASKLIGKNVSSPQGERLGKLSDIVFGPKQGIFGIVEVSGQQRTAVPWQLVTAITDSAVVMNTTPSALTKAPAVSGTNFESFNDPQFTQQLFTYYKVDKEGMGSAADSSTGSGSSSSQDQRSQSQDTKPDSEKK